MDYTTHSVSETQKVATTIAEACKGGEIFALSGPLGAGKTAFVQGLAMGLNVPASQRVTSPTFTLIQEYLGGRLPLYHIDFYRIEKKTEIDYLGLEEYFEAGGVMVVEWAEKFKDFLPAKTKWFQFEIVSETKRRIFVKSPPL